MKKIAIAMAVVLAVTGCASNYRPVVDTRGGPGNYEQDLAECRAFAGSDGMAGAGAVIGGLFGLGIAALSLAGSGIRGDGLRRGAAAVGAISGALSVTNQQRGIIATCMANRGYAVLDR